VFFIIIPSRILKITRNFKARMETDKVAILERIFSPHAQKNIPGSRDITAFFNHPKNRDNQIRFLLRDPWVFRNHTFSSHFLVADPMYNMV
jgi:hypothetical protein